MVYHYSDKLLSEFESKFSNYFVKKGGVPTAIFFIENPNPKIGTVLDRSYKYPIFLSIANMESVTGTKDELRELGTSFTENYRS